MSKNTMWPAVSEFTEWDVARLEKYISDLQSEWKNIFGMDRRDLEAAERALKSAKEKAQFKVEREQSKWYGLKNPTEAFIFPILYEKINDILKDYGLTHKAAPESTLPEDFIERVRALLAATPDASLLQGLNSNPKPNNYFPELDLKPENYFLEPILKENYYLWIDGQPYSDFDGLVRANEEWRRQNYPFILPNGDYFHWNADEFFIEKKRIKAGMYQEIDNSKYKI